MFYFSSIVSETGSTCVRCVQFYCPDLYVSYTRRLCAQHVSSSPPLHSDLSSPCTLNLFCWLPTSQYQKMPQTRKQLIMLGDRMRCDDGDDGDVLVEMEVVQKGWCDTERKRGGMARFMWPVLLYIHWTDVCWRDWGLSWKKLGEKTWGNLGK